MIFTKNRCPDTFGVPVLAVSCHILCWTVALTFTEEFDYVAMKHQDVGMRYGCSASGCYIMGMG